MSVEELMPIRIMYSVYNNGESLFIAAYKAPSALIWKFMPRFIRYSNKLSWKLVDINNPYVKR